MLTLPQFRHWLAMRRLDTQASTGCAAPASHLSANPATPWFRGISWILVLALSAMAAACGGKAAGPPAPQPVATADDAGAADVADAGVSRAARGVEYGRDPAAGGGNPAIGRRRSRARRSSADQMLFEIDPQPYSAALAQAQAGLAQAHAAQAQART